MQNVRVLSSETNELTHVTPSSALRSTTARQISAPPFSIGMCSPSEKTRCTTYRGISVLLFDRTLDMRPTYARAPVRTSGGVPRLALAPTYLSSARCSYQPDATLSSDGSRHDRRGHRRVLAVRGPPSGLDGGRER